MEELSIPDALGPTLVCGFMHIGCLVSPICLLTSIVFGLETINDVALFIAIVSPDDQNYIVNLLFDDTWMIDNIHRYTVNVSVDININKP